MAFVLEIVLLEHSHAHCNGDHVAHTAENIYYLALDRKSLSTPALDGPKFFILFIYFFSSLNARRDQNEM